MRLVRTRIINAGPRVRWAQGVLCPGCPGLRMRCAQGALDSECAVSRVHSAPGALGSGCAAHTGQTASEHPGSRKIGKKLVELPSMIVTLLCKVISKVIHT